MHRLCAGLCVLAFAACSTTEPYVPPGFVYDESTAEESAPLGGAALDQRRTQLMRMYRDLAHLQRTLDSLRHHSDRQGLNQLRRFADAYIGMHLDPLLATQWQSDHPELMAVDASLRFAKADVLMRVKDSGRARKVVSEIRRRFAGRESMLVDYPIGGQSSLADALQILEDGRWENPAP